MAPAAALAVFACIAFAFLALTYAHVTSDFSVAERGRELALDQAAASTRSPGVWGNHEGSMLLWVLILALFGGIVALGTSSVPARLQANTLAVQAAVTLAFLLFILITSNPFARVDPGAARGAGPEPAAAGSRPRDPSAASLHRLCRLLDRLRLRRARR